jgi:hypothetical protein
MKAQSILSGVLGLSAFLILAVPPPLLAGEIPLVERKRDPVTVRFPAGADREAIVVLDNMPEILTEVTRFLMVSPPPRITVSLVNNAVFEKRVGKRKGEWAVAVAYSQQGSIFINLGRLDLRNNLYTTLKHETVHLVLGGVERQAGRRLPQWFHEGVAQRICGRLFSGTREEFLVASKAGNLFPLAEITEAFPASGPAVNIAYAQAEDFIAFLEQERPLAVSRILARFAQGLSFPDAARETLGEPLSVWETRWKENLASGPPFFVAWLQSNPGAIWILLFTGGALLVFIGYLRVLRRRRQLMKEWAAEEGEDEEDDDEEEPWGDPY